MTNKEWDDALTNPEKWDIIGKPGSPLRIELYAKRISENKPIFEEQNEISPD